MITLKRFLVVVAVVLVSRLGFVVHRIRRVCSPSHQVLNYCPYSLLLSRDGIHRTVAMCRRFQKKNFVDETPHYCYYSSFQSFVLKFKVVVRSTRKSTIFEDKISSFFGTFLSIIKVSLLLTSLELNVELNSLLLTDNWPLSFFIFFSYAFWLVVYLLVYVHKAKFKRPLLDA